ncbi:MAG: hypothetical protein IKF90_08555, partial [Parasporobacterium sp.]|nr:hypothetical protein [Parasporobacterium sp.]
GNAHIQRDIFAGKLLCDQPALCSACKKKNFVLHKIRPFLKYISKYTMNTENGLPETDKTGLG